MTLRRKVRPNLTNYDLLELIQNELYESEKRIIRKVMLIVATSALALILLVALVVTTKANVIRNYAAEAMKKAFEAEHAVQIIDEAAGTNFLEQSKIERALD